MRSRWHAAVWGERHSLLLLSLNFECCSHLPTHSSREILIIFGSLTTCDPGNIHDTLGACVRNKIRISVVALAAEMKICRDMCDKTGGGSSDGPVFLPSDEANRPIWGGDERGTLQGSALRACPSASPTSYISRWWRKCESCCRSDDDGFSDAPPRLVATESLCMPLGHEERRLSLSAMYV